MPRLSRRIRTAVILAVVPFVVRWLLQFWGSTWRVRVTGYRHLRAARAAGVPVIAAALHARNIVLAYTMVRPFLRPWVIIASESRDAQIIIRFIEAMGMQVIRGSRGHEGARAFLGVIRSLREHPERLAGLLIDGSRGPRGHCKGGVVRLAMRSGGLILPVTISAAPAYIARRSWDRQVWPLPWARVLIAFGPLMAVPRGDDAEVARQCRRVERVLLARTAALDRHVGFHDPEPLQAVRRRA